MLLDVNHVNQRSDSTSCVFTACEVYQSVLDNYGTHYFYLHFNQELGDRGIDLLDGFLGTI
ncbi:12603_t:CDS:2 [Rhizophagus irregularis]|nr:12603_t:CDS:2 [Rhizophagus irregularis]